MNIASAISVSARLGKAALFLGAASIVPFSAWAQERKRTTAYQHARQHQRILVTGTKTKDAENVQDCPDRGDRV